MVNTRIFRILFSIMIMILLLTSLVYSEEREYNNRVIQALDTFALGMNALEERPLLTNYGGFGSSILARIRGVSYNEETGGTFVLAVPLDAEFSVETGIAFAEIVTDKPLPINVLVAFLADERLALLTEGNSHKGLRDLLTLVDLPENWVLCYLDVREIPGELVIHHRAGDYLAPLEIIRPLTDLLISKDITWSFNSRQNALNPELLSIIWEEEINNFYLTAKSLEIDEAIEKSITPTDLAELLVEYAQSLYLPVINTDRHYSFFNFPGKNSFYINEGLTTLLLLGTIIVSLLVYLIYSTRKNVIVFYHLRFFIKYIWVFLLLFPLLALLIYAVRYFYSILLSFLNPSISTVNNTGSILIFLLAGAAFFLPFPVPFLSRFHRRAWFYGFSGVMWVAIGILFSIFIDFSYALVFLWAYCFAFMGASFSNPILIVFFAIMIPLFSFNTILLNDSRSWLAAFQAALITLPVLLLFKRAIVLFQKPKKRKFNPALKRRLYLIIAPLLVIFFVAAMIVQITLLPENVIIQERRFITENNQTEDITNLSLESLIFQDSRIITLQFGARGNPLRFDIFLESESGLILLPVYSATTPFERRDEGRTIVFSLGDHPPNPLTVEIVVPENFMGRLSASAVFNYWDPLIDTDERPYTQDYVLRVTRSVDL